MCNEINDLNFATNVAKPGRQVGSRWENKKPATIVANLSAIESGVYIYEVLGDMGVDLYSVVDDVLKPMQEISHVTRPNTARISMGKEKNRTP